jgi:Fe-S-cluster containining protein
LSDKAAEALTRYRAIRDALDAFHVKAEDTLPVALACRRGCSACCSREIHVFEVEAAAIRSALGDIGALESSETNSGCPMLDAAGGCRIYAERPLICRSHGLPVKFRQEDNPLESRDICPLNEDVGVDPWTAPPAAILNLDVLNAQLALVNRLYGGDGRRIPISEVVRPPSG